MSATTTSAAAAAPASRVRLVLSIFKLRIAVLIMVTALGGMLWSFLSRQNAPDDAPEIKARHLPPSAKPEKPAMSAVPPAPTLPAPR